jgi:ankyrin repeat protein
MLFCSLALLSSSQERPIDQRLYEALAKSDVARVKQLLDKGADPNADSANGWRPLISLDTSSTKCVDIAKLLISHGANVNYRQPGQGWTPLTSALNGGGPPELVRLLLSQGADANLTMRDGTTPLMLAVRYSNAAAVRELLSARAKVNARATEDPDAVHNPRNDDEIAGSFEPGFRWSGQNVATELGSHWDGEIASLISAAGGDLKATDDNGWTGLHYAVKMGSMEGIRGLLRFGIDPNAASKEGFTALHLAVRSGFGLPNEAIAAALLAAGSDPKIKNRQGQTPAELLRADVTLLLRKTLTSPKELSKDEFVRRYLQTANAVAQRLEPGSKKIVAPDFPSLNGIPIYPPLKISTGLDSESTILLSRAMSLAGGKTTLKLVPVSPIPAGVKLRITQIQLNNYESLTPLPQAADGANGFTFRFRAEAASGGCALRYSYGFVAANSSGSGSDIEGWYPNPSFLQMEAKNGKQVSIQCDLRDRPLQVRLDSVALNGKPQKAFKGKVMLVKGAKPTSIGVFPNRASIGLKYSYRLVPNLQWETGAMELGR